MTGGLNGSSLSDIYNIFTQGTAATVKPASQTKNTPQSIKTELSAEALELFNLEPERRKRRLAADRGEPLAQFEYGKML